MSRTPDDYRREGIRDHGAALALAQSAVDYLKFDEPTDKDLEYAAHMLHIASQRADHAATMLRMARPNEPKSEIARDTQEPEA